MNNAHGLKCVVSHPSSMKIIARSLHSSHIANKTMVLEMLGAVCLISDGYQKVLDALTHFKDFAGERTRFQVGHCERTRCWLCYWFLVIGPS